MTNKFGPTRADLKFRLFVSVLGLGMMFAALAYRGMPQGAAGWEAIIIASVFFGGTLLWTLRKLIKGDYSDGL